MELFLDPEILKCTKNVKEIENPLIIIQLFMPNLC